MNGPDVSEPPSGSEMPTVIGWPVGPASRLLVVAVLSRPHAATAALAVIIAASRKVLAVKRLIGLLSFFHGNRARVERDPVVRGAPTVLRAPPVVSLGPRVA